MPLEPQTYRQYAYLRITGARPSQEITRIIGCNPDEAWSTGDKWRRVGPNESRRFSMWKRNSGLNDDQGLNQHIQAIIQFLHTKRPEIQELLKDFDICVVCVSHSLQSFSFEMSFDNQLALSQMGIRTWFDAYIDEDVHKMMYDLRCQLGHDMLEQSD